MSFLPRFNLSLLVLPALLLPLSPLCANNAPVLDAPIPAPGELQKVAPLVPAGKTLLIPLTATDADGDPLTYTVKSSNPKLIVAQVKTGNPFLRLSVSHPGENGGAAPFAGDMVFQLFRDWTPMTADYIAGFAQSGFYDGLTFHRIADLMKDDDANTPTSFIAQGGDSSTRAEPPPTFRFENEFHPGVIFTGRGQLAMANAGYNTNITIENNQIVHGDWSASNHSQFFITDAQPRFLDFKHTIFGQLTRGWDVFEKVVAVPRDAADKPTQPLTITSARIEVNRHDAVLVLGALGAGPSTITVTVSDGKGGVSTRSFVATGVADEWNTRPFLLPPGDAVAQKDRPFRAGVSLIDLEFDYVFRNQELIGNAGANATLQQGVITPRAGYTGPLRIGFTATEYDMTYRGPIDGAGPQVEDRTAITIGVGDKAIRPVPLEFVTQPGAAFSGMVVGQFVDSDTQGTAADFVAKINWGDGSGVTSGVIVTDATRPGVGRFAVTGAHAYARAGRYPVVVEVTGNRGAKTLIRSSALVTASPLNVFGERIQAGAPSFTNRVIATFTADPANGGAAAYNALIDWGNGSASPGKIKAAEPGRFSVIGSHAYGEAGAFSVRVDVHRTGTEERATAWSIVSLGGFKAPHSLPPYPQAHLIAAWEGDPVRTTTGAGANSKTSFKGSVIVINSGNKKSPRAKLRFWLSKDKVLNKSGPDPDVLLKIGSFKQATISPLQPGGGVRYLLDKIAGQNLRLNAPKGETGAAMNLLIELDYKDPIIDHSAVDKVALWGPYSAIIVDAAANLMTTESGGTAEFTVRLERKPSANVTIAVSTSNTNEGAIVLPAANTATPPKHELVFTPENYSQRQTVRVRGVDDQSLDGDVSYNVAFAPAVSGDPLYHGMTRSPVLVKNLDNESGIRVNSAGSVTTTESGGMGFFSITLQRLPTAPVTIEVESSDLTEGTVSPATLIFTTSNWNQAQVVTVSGVDDDEVDGDVTYSIIMKPAVSADPFYNGKIGPSVSVTNTDNDGPPEAEEADDSPEDVDESEEGDPAP